MGRDGDVREGMVTVGQYLLTVKFRRPRTDTGTEKNAAGRKEGISQ